MLADRIKGGTLILGGTENGDGVAKVLDGTGKEIVRLDNNGVFAAGKYVCGADEYGRYVEISEGEYKILAGNRKTVGRIHAISDNWVRIDVGDDGNTAIRMLADSKSIFVDAENFGVNGKIGQTGRAEFSDGTYLEFEGGVLVGGQTSEGGF